MGLGPSKPFLIGPLHFQEGIILIMHQVDATLVRVNTVGGQFTAMDI
jgi:hypothetical protein